MTAAIPPYGVSLHKIPLKEGAYLARLPLFFLMLNFPNKSLPWPAIMLEFINHTWTEVVSLYSAIFFSLVIAWLDHRTMIIPNRWVYAFALVSLILAVIRSVLAPTDPDLRVLYFPVWPTCAEALGGCTIGFVFTLYFWMRGWIGGGDVKLALALGLCVGYQRILHIMLITHLLAFLFSRADWILKRLSAKNEQLRLQSHQQNCISMGPFYATALLMVL